MRSDWLRGDRVALAAGIAAPAGISVALVPFRSSFANTDAALVLVAVVVAVAAGGHRLAGYVAAASSAAWFDFFLTQPYDRFEITRRTDVETTVLLLVIGVAVTELAVWGRHQNASANRRAGYLQGIYAAAEGTTSRGGPEAVIAHVCGQLTELLGLLDCHFQRGFMGVGVVARLHHDGRVTVNDDDWDIEALGLPRREIELLVQTGGLLRGRFLMLPAQNKHPTLEHRLVAVALADQAGAALAGQDLSRR